VKFLPGDFVCFAGFLRQGKTSSAVHLCKRLSVRGWPIRSNIALSFASGDRIKTVEQLVAVRGSVLFIDELQDSMYNREYNSKQSIFLAKQSILFGKRGNIVVYTAPDFGMVDKSYRQLTRNVFECAKVSINGRLYSHTRYSRYDGVGGILNEMGSFLVPIYKVLNDYNTFDEDVTLSFASANTDEPRVAQPSGASLSGSDLLRRRLRQ
jgi:hypothetical protein